MQIFRPTLLVALIAQIGMATAANADSHNIHHYDEPYQCDRDREVTSSRTGETRVVYYRTVYFPERDWQFVLTDVWADKSALGGRGIANLYTPDFRYDGVYRDQDNDITSISMGSAWSKEDRSPGVSVRRTKDNDIGQCALLSVDQTAFYTLDYLDGLEVME